MAKQLFVLIVLIIFILGIVTNQIPLPVIGAGDFRGYWAASYLLGHSQNFADESLVFTLQQEQTNWTKGFAVMSWNPPWVLALFLPYTLFPFFTAAKLWFLTTTTLVFTAAILLWLTYPKQHLTQSKNWLAALFAFLFIPTLVSLFMGQPNILVFFGLATYLYAQKHNRPLLASAGLTLTLVKPHLVYITFPIIILRAIYKREWAVIINLTCLIGGLIIIAFWFRPTLLTDYTQTIGSNNLLSWQTPTLGGILAYSLGWQWAKLMGILILPLFSFIWWKYYPKVELSELVHTTLLASVITASFGWGYDVIVLLIPLLQICKWIVDKEINLQESIMLVIALIVLNGLIFYHRTHASNEVHFFWVPIVIALLYYVARQLRFTSTQNLSPVV